MGSLGNGRIKYYTILIILLINLLYIIILAQCNTQYNDSPIKKIEIKDLLKTGTNISITSQGSRAPDLETEPNNNIQDAVNNNNELKDSTSIDGQLVYNKDETDFFYIDLQGGAQNTIERVNITPVFSDLLYLDSKAVGIRIKAYTTYKKELYLLEYKGLGTNQAIINDSFPWENSTSLFFNADQTSRYYISVTAAYIIDANTNKVIDPGAIINYTLHVKITRVTNQDKNNDPLNGTALTGPKKDLKVIQNIDHWDWYKIDSLTENRNVNISIKITITNAILTDITHYVKVTGILRCFDLITNSYIETRANGDWLGSYHPTTFSLALEARFDTVYLGIHGQQILWVKNQETDSPNCGESVVDYEIKELTLDLKNNPPELLNWSATPEKGNLKDQYYFNVLYQDKDNDIPYFINITIAGVNYPMKKSTNAINDGDYTNGELYELTIPGSSFEDIPHEKYKNLKFSFSSMDYFSELELPLQLVVLDPSSYISVIDNVLPILSDDIPENWTIAEDSKPYYIKLTQIFTDPDKKKYPGDMTYEVWLDKYGWKNITESNIIRATVMDNNTLKIEPKLNKYGTDTIRIQAYDIEGKLKALEYTITIIVYPVNDPPVFIQPKDVNDAKEDQYVNITFHATDATDDYVDSIVYSIDIFTKIPALGTNPGKFFFNFSETLGNLSFLPDNSLVGSYEINITATDAGSLEPVGLSTSRSFQLTILNVNDPPVAIITYPRHNAKFNTSSVIPLSAEDTTDDDLIYGDKLEYYWFLNVKDVSIVDQTLPISELKPIRTKGKHILYLKVKDKSGAFSWDNVTIWIISLVGDSPNGEDSDGDGIPDIWEIAYDLDPDKIDSDEDPDGDNFTNMQEFLGNDGKIGGADSSDPHNPLSYPGDRDGDQLPDFWEDYFVKNLGLDKNSDIDGDGFTNYQEYLGRDGVPGNDDWSDPLDTKDTPKSKKGSAKKKVDDTSIFLILGIVIVIIIIMLLLLSMIVSKRKKKAEKEKIKSEEKTFYTPEPIPGLTPRIQPQVQLPYIPPNIQPSSGMTPIGQPLQRSLAQPSLQKISVPILPQSVQQIPIKVPPPSIQQTELYASGHQNVQLSLPPSGQVLERKEQIDKRNQHEQI